MDNPAEITVLSLCTGYGGLELGFSRALANPLRVVAVEIEAYAAANLVAKAEEGKLAIEALWPDLRTFEGERFRGCFDFITAGYPCQGESVAGKGLGEKDPRYLWPHIERLIKAGQPSFCFFENVANHLRGTFPNVLRSLRAMGYKVEAGLFSAAETGLSIAGERLFVLASANSHGCEYGSCKKPNLTLAEGSILPSGGGHRKVERLAWSFCTTESFEWESIPRICGSTNGVAHQMDRLRLLGNGVVPQQAEKAFRELWKLF